MTLKVGKPHVDPSVCPPIRLSAGSPISFGAFAEAALKAH